MGHRTRDPSPSQQRWLRSHAGSIRAVYNWALAEVGDSRAVTADERAPGIPEGQLPPALSWTAFSIAKRWRAVRDEVRPWHRCTAVPSESTGTATPPATPPAKASAFSANSSRPPRSAGRRHTPRRDPVRPNPHSTAVRVGADRSRPQPDQPARHVRAAGTFRSRWRGRRTRPCHRDGDGPGHTAAVLSAADQHPLPNLVPVGDGCATGIPGGGAIWALKRGRLLPNWAAGRSDGQVQPPAGGRFAGAGSGAAVCPGRLGCWPPRCSCPQDTIR